MKNLHMCLPPGSHVADNDDDSSPGFLPGLCFDASTLSVAAAHCSHPDINAAYSALSNSGLIPASMSYSHSNLEPYLLIAPEYSNVQLQLLVSGEIWD
jgi:hypothetical protein